jgi:hypothetical protein
MMDIHTLTCSATGAMMANNESYEGVGGGLNMHSVKPLVYISVFDLEALRGCSPLSVCYSSLIPACALSADAIQASLPETLWGFFVWGTVGVREPRAAVGVIYTNGHQMVAAVQGKSQDLCWWCDGWAVGAKRNWQ